MPAPVLLALVTSAEATPEEIAQVCGVPSNAVCRWVLDATGNEFLAEVAKFLVGWPLTHPDHGPASRSRSPSSAGGSSGAPAGASPKARRSRKGPMPLTSARISTLTAVVVSVFSVVGVERRDHLDPGLDGRQPGAAAGQRRRGHRGARLRRPEHRPRLPLGLLHAGRRTVRDRRQHRRRGGPRHRRGHHAAPHGRCGASTAPCGTCPTVRSCGWATARSSGPRPCSTSGWRPTPTSPMPRR